MGTTQHCKPCLCIMELHIYAHMHGNDESSCCPLSSVLDIRYTEPKLKIFFLLFSVICKFIQNSKSFILTLIITTKECRNDTYNYLNEGGTILLHAYTHTHTYKYIHVCGYNYVNETLSTDPYYAVELIVRAHCGYDYLYKKQNSTCDTECLSASKGFRQQEARRLKRVPEHDLSSLQSIQK